MKLQGKNPHKFARLARVMSGHAPCGEFVRRFNLPGLTECLCNEEIEESLIHVFHECPLWIKTYKDECHHGKALKLKLEDIEVFLATNRMALTFEVRGWIENYWEDYTEGNLDSEWAEKLVSYISLPKALWVAGGSQLNDLPTFQKEGDEDFV